VQTNLDGRILLIKCQFLEADKDNNDLDYFYIMEQERATDHTLVPAYIILDKELAYDKSEKKYY